MNDAKYEQWRKRYRLLTDYENFNGDAEQLRWAAQDGDLETCRRLVASGVSVNAPGRQGKAPLHYAAERGNREVAEFLMDSGADPLQGDEYGNTPQLHAMQTAHMVQLLITCSNLSTVPPRSPSQVYDDILSKSRLRSPKPSPQPKVPALALSVANGALGPTPAVDNEGALEPTTAVEDEANAVAAADES